MNLYPQLSAVADQKSKYSISANHYALQNTKEVQRSTLTWKSTARQRMQRMRTIARQFPDQYMSEQDDSILFHEAGVASATPIRTEQRHVADLQQINDGWRLLDQQGKEIMQAQQVVLAAGAGMNDLQPIPLKLVRGQSILAQSNNKITQVTSGDISIANIGDQLFHVGSTYQPDDCDLTDRLEDSNYLLALLERHFPLSDWSLDSSFVGVRAAPVDRNPIVGPLPQWQLLQQQPFSWYQNQGIPAQKGLYCIAGFGSKGGSHGPLAGEHLANLITGEPTPLTGSQQKYFSPARFWLQQANKKTARKRHDHR
jgi:glycine/D-amino acid oxidase-like deaminating enzyme